MQVLRYRQTPVIRCDLPEARKAGVGLFLKREDLNHPLVSGNKWWKLKYNLEEAKRSLTGTLLTFGGAYSNHIYATAAAAEEAGFASIGVIRGEDIQPRNATLAFAARHGMQLHFVTRQQYRMKTEAAFVRDLREKFSDFYLIPEGGSNPQGIKGCIEFAQTQLLNIDFDYLVLPVGTGATMAGLIGGLPPEKKVVGVSVLKAGEFLKTQIEGFVRNFSGRSYGNWELLTSYHHGGYAKVTDDLLRFIVMMQDQHNLPFDRVYTGKMMWAVAHELEKGFFSRGSNVLVLHTGGLQGSTPGVSSTRTA